MWKLLEISFLKYYVHLMLVIVNFFKAKLEISDPLNKRDL